MENASKAITQLAVVPGDARDISRVRNISTKKKVMESGMPIISVIRTVARITLTVVCKANIADDMGIQNEENSGLMWNSFFEVS